MRCRYVVTILISLAIGPSLFAQQRPQRDKPVAPLVGTGVVSGTTVTDDANAQPLARVQLLIVGTDTGYMKITEADDQGRFSLADLPAGRYLLGATKIGFLDAAYGARRPGRPGTQISLADGEHLTSIVLKMTLGGVATGIVTDERGQPMQGATVQLQSTAIKPGGSMASGIMISLMNQGRGLTAATDDRGVYRVFSVAPGDYTVMVTPPPNPAGDAHVVSADEIQAALQALHDTNRPAGGQTIGSGAPVSTVLPASTNGRGAGANMPDFSNPLMQSMMASMPGAAGSGPTMGYAPVYYPGTTESTEAATVTIKAGEERAGLDVRAQLVSTARIDCQVMGPGGQPMVGVQVSLLQTGKPSTSLADLIGSRRFVARPGADGRYTFTGIPPGKYTVTARAIQTTMNASLPQPDPSTVAAMPTPTLWASADVAINGQNVSGLLLTMQPGLTLSGRVVLHSDKPVDPTKLQISVSLRPPQIDLAGLAMMNASSSAAVRPDLSFTLEGVVPAKYMLSGMAAAGGADSAQDMSGLFGWTIESATIGGKDAADLPFDVPPSGEIKDAVVTFTDRKQEVFGTLQDAAGRGAPDYTVVLFPADKRYWLPGSRRIVTARPATDGRFELGGATLSLGAMAPSGLPPGEYLLAAVTDLGPDEQYDTKLLAALAKAAVPITLAPGERRQQDLRVAGGG